MGLGSGSGLARPGPKPEPKPKPKPKPTPKPKPKPTGAISVGNVVDLSALGGAASSRQPVLAVPGITAPVLAAASAATHRSRGPSTCPER